MNVQTIEADGDYCPINGAYVPASETNIAHTFAREIAKLRSPYYESPYEEVERDDHLAFAGGFKK